MRSFFQFALATAICSASATLADPTWTTRDLDAVADAAVQTAAGQSVQVPWLVLLAEALTKAGDTPRAKAVLLEAAKLLPPPGEIGPSWDRGNIVKELAGLGGASDAEKLADVDVPRPTRVMLLSKLVSGLAAAGATKDVHRVADRLAPLADTPGITSWVIATPISSSLAGAGAGLVASGATDEVLYLANRLPEGIPRVRLLSDAAFALCDITGKGANPGMGRKVAEDVRKSASAALPLITAPIDRVEVVEIAAEAVAKCDGADRAKAFVSETTRPPQTDQVLSRLADRLTDKREFDLAAATAPPIDANDADDLLGVAKRLAKQGDTVAAVRAATAASQVALDTQTAPSQPPSNRYDHFALLNRIFGVLADLGAYDTALATVQPIELVNRQQYYVTVVQAAINRKDSAAIAHLLPTAIDAVTQPTPAGTRAESFLFGLTRTLANNGYRDEAKKPYEALIQFTNSASATSRDHLLPWQLAVLKADTGDLASALQAANDAGPLTTKPTPAMVGVLTVMQFDGATKPPSQSELAAAMQRSTNMLPNQVSGPKANALSAIAIDMAVQGNIEGALKAETELDVEPRAALSGARDTALSSIATAQQKACDLRGSFSTTLRIEQASVRWGCLLKLAAEPSSR